MMLGKEIFIDNLLKDYPEKLEDIISECKLRVKNNHPLNVDELNTNLAECIQNHFVFFLNEADWLSIIFEVHPDKYDEIIYPKAA